MKSYGNIPCYVRGGVAMAYGYKDIVCAPMRKRSVDTHFRRQIRYLTSVAILNNLHHRGEISLATWYVAENALATRYHMSDNSIYRVWSPDHESDFPVQRAERSLYMRNTK